HRGRASGCSPHSASVVGLVQCGEENYELSVYPRSLSRQILPADHGCFSLIGVEDYEQEQEMEIEALQAILMDDIEEIDPNVSGLNTDKRCFQITLVPHDDDADEAISVPVSTVELMRVDTSAAVRLALVFSHTSKYPDEPPLLKVKSLQGVKPDDLKILQEKLEQEASENLGMAMVYTLATSAKEWLSEFYGQSTVVEEMEENDSAKEDIIIPHGEHVTVETFMAWRDRFEAELALERAKSIPDSELTAPKEKKLTGRQYFESGKHTMKAAASAEDSEEEEDEDIEFDDDDFEDDDEEDMLEHYLSEKAEIAPQGSRK
ncbi:RWD domain-containing protein 1, partial [Nymphaea thermarum]